MNRRASVWIGSILGGAMCLQGGVGGRVALGAVMRTPPGTAIPLATKTAAVIAPNGNDAKLIHDFISAQLSAVNGTSNAVSQQAARQYLINECPRPITGQVTSPAYITAYALELTAQANKANMLSRTAPLRVRLDLAVALSSITVNAPSHDFDPAVIQLLADPSPAVALHGLKASRPLVMTAIVELNGTGTRPLFKAIVDSVKNHPGGDFAGPMAVDAYRALVVDPRNVPGQSEASARPMLKVLFNPVLDLLEFRTGLYAKELVGAPEAEHDVPTFLSGEYKDFMTPAQQQRCVQDLLDLIFAAGQRAPLANANRPVLNALVDTIKRAAQALTVMYDAAGASGQPLAKITSLGLDPTGETVATVTSTAFQDISPRFPKLTKPTALPPVNAPPPPLVVPPAVVVPVPGAAVQPVTPKPPTTPRRGG